MYPTTENSAQLLPRKIHLDHEKSSSSNLKDSWGSQKNKRSCHSPPPCGGGDIWERKIPDPCFAQFANSATDRDTPPTLHTPPLQIRKPKIPPPTSNCLAKLEIYIYLYILQSATVPSEDTNCLKHHLFPLSGKVHPFCFPSLFFFFKKKRKVRKVKG